MRADNTANRRLSTKNEPLSLLMYASLRETCLKTPRLRNSKDVRLYSSSWLRNHLRCTRTGPRTARTPSQGLLCTPPNRLFRSAPAVLDALLCNGGRPLNDVGYPMKVMRAQSCHKALSWGWQYSFITVTTVTAVFHSVVYRCRSNVSCMM